MEEISGLDWGNIFNYFYFFLTFFFFYIVHILLWKIFFAQLHQNTILVSSGTWSVGPYVTGETAEWNVNTNRCCTSFCSPLRSIVVYVIMWFLRGNSFCWQISIYWVQHWTAEACCKLSSLNSVIQQSHHPSWEIWKWQKESILQSAAGDQLWHTELAVCSKHHLGVLRIQDCSGHFFQRVLYFCSFLEVGTICFPS